MAAESLPRHDPGYRHELPGGMLVRWSTPDDMAGVALTGALAFNCPEGGESLFAVATTRRTHMEEFYYGACRWAICVGTSGPRSFPRKKPTRQDEKATAYDRDLNTMLSEPEHPFVDSIRKQAEQAQEPVLALVGYHPMEWRMSGHPVKVAKHVIVACRPACRASGGGVVMKELFAMCHERAIHERIAFSDIKGIPNYYKLHGFEHAIRLGPFFETQASWVPAVPEPSSGATDVYTSRDGTLNDAQAIVPLAQFAADISPLMFGLGPHKVLPEVEWELGHRPPIYDPEPPEVAPATPVLILERNGKIVAAISIVIWAYFGTPVEKRIWVKRCWLDQGADLAVLAKELVPRVFAHAQRLCREDRERERAKNERAGKPIDGELSQTPSLTRLPWMLSGSHPLSQMMLRLGLANPDPPTSYYNFLTNHYIKLHSLALFFEGIRPVLADRLAAASDVLGHSCTAKLRISTYSSSYPGAIISVKNGKIDSIEEHRYTGAQIMGFHPLRPKEESPNVIGPQPALTKLLMGFATLEQVRAFIPDFSVLPDAVPLLEALFPLVHPITHFYE